MVASFSVLLPLVASAGPRHAAGKVTQAAPEFVYVASTTGGVWQFRINEDAFNRAVPVGGLIPLSPPIVAAPPGTNDVVVDPANRFAYTSSLLVAEVLEISIFVGTSRR